MTRFLYNPFSKIVMLFLFGGGVYVGLECLFRGYSHGSMFVVGGLCFLCLIALSKLQQFSFWQKSILGGLTISVIEFAAGCILNLWLGLGVWDYSGAPFHLLGQVCLPFTVLWCGLTAIVLFVIDKLTKRLPQLAKPISASETPEANLTKQVEI